jgi:large subunit ribosomal protein L6
MVARWQLPQAIRFFSSTAARPHGFISYIGRKPIQFLPSITLDISPTSIAVKGPLGETSVPLEPFIKISHPQSGMIQLAVEDPKSRKQRQMWGLTRSCINNAVTGMTEGFSVNLYLLGVGYRAALEDDPRGMEEGGNGKRLNMKLGFSHPVYVPIPADIKAEVPTATKITLFCTDKQRIGQFAAEIRQWRKPEPYKGKVRIFAKLFFLVSLTLCL